MSNQIRVTLHSTITGKDDSDPADVILQRIQTIRQSVAQLRDDNMNLERYRDQYIIHLQQCQEDHNILRQIYRRLKLKLDSATQDAQVPEVVQPRAAVPVAPPSQPAPVAVPVSETKPSVPVARRMATLESIKIKPRILTHDKLPDTAVRLRYALNTTSVICSVQYSPDGSKIAFADGSYVYIVQSKDGEIINTIQLAPPSDPAIAHTRALKFSPNGQYLALSSPSNEVLLYNIETQQLVHAYKGHEKEVSSIVFNADGSWLISGSFDGQILVWDTTTHELVKHLPHKLPTNDGTIVEIATTPEVPFYAVGFMSGTIGIYSENFDQPMMSFEAHQNILMGLSVSPFDETIATVSQDKNVKIWQMRGVASCKHTLSGHTDFVLSVCFSPKSHIMITGSKDQMLKIWNHKQGKLLFTVSAHSNTLFEIDHHPTDRSFVSCSGDGVVCVWDYDELI